MPYSPDSTDDPIDSRQLRVFATLAHGGGLKTAAATLNVTESAISHTIRNLEASLQVKLFLRTGKGLVLTPSGALLLEESVDILRRMREIRGKLTLSEGNKVHRIRLIAGTSFIKSIFPDVYLEFRQCFPETAVSVVAADRDCCLLHLARDEADIAVLVNIDEDDPETDFRPLFCDHLQVVLAADHPLAALESIPVHALCRETVFVTRKDNYTMRMIQGEIGKKAFQIQTVTEVSSHEGLSEMVRLGLGVTLQSPWAFPEGWADSSLCWRPVRGLTLRREWSLAWQARRTIDIRLKTLAHICQRATAHLLHHPGTEVKATESPLVPFQAGNALPGIRNQR